MYVLQCVNIQFVEMKIASVHKILVLQSFISKLAEKWNREPYTDRNRTRTCHNRQVSYLLGTRRCSFIANYQVGRKTGPKVWLFWICSIKVTVVNYLHFSLKNLIFISLPSLNLHYHTFILEYLSLSLTLLINNLIFQ